MNEKYTISGDSDEYDFLTEAVGMSAGVEGMCCEIGLRRGFGTKTIIDAVLKYCPTKKVISIDPFGHIPYAHKEGEVVRLDYDNSMKVESLAALNNYIADNPVNHQFFNLTDTRFFERNADGVYWYDMEEILEAKYAMVHADGPHDVASIKTELDFFLPRMDIGAVIVFDDVISFYPHEEIEAYIADKFEIIKTGGKKQIVRKIC